MCDNLEARHTTWLWDLARRIEGALANLIREIVVSFIKKVGHIVKGGVVVVAVVLGRWWRRGGGGRRERIYLSIYLSIDLSIDRSIYLSIYIDVYVYV